MEVRREVLKIVQWDAGTERVHYEHSTTSACVEVRIGTGQVIQLIVNADGKVLLRAWGNKPVLMGNVTSHSMHFLVAPQEATHDELYRPLAGKEASHVD